MGAWRTLTSSGAPISATGGRIPAQHAAGHIAQRLDDDASRRRYHGRAPVTEADLEQACIGWFRELGWSHAPGEAISPGGAQAEREHYTQVILASRLREALSRLNPELPIEAHDEAVKRLVDYAGQSLVDANREIYTWLRDGIPVEVEQDGHRRGRSAQVFDFDDPDNNDWLIVNQFTVKGKMTCRPDLMVLLSTASRSP